MSAPGTAPSPVVLITGGATGIGRAVAAACGRSGATVVLLSLPGPELSQAIDELSGAGVAAQAVAADVRDFAAVQQAAGQVHGELGRIDALVASAGIADQSSITSGSPERWQQVVQTNLLGTANAIRAVAPLMVAAGAGDIVMIASASGRDSYVGEPLYIASKWGVVGLGHAVRKELQASNIRVALIEPGLVDTPLTRGSPVVRPLVEAGGAMLPGDIAEAVVWLLARPRRVSVTELVIRPTAVGDIERI
ncbi:MAG TPA: SDR family oxidoreductase [Streptosporangiaceae bacterium]|nr:SDR family oxidoreductase [Streptosporangiaceae bacterium]